MSSTIINYNAYSKFIDSEYEAMPESWIANDLSELVISMKSSDIILTKFDKIPDEKLAITVNYYYLNNNKGLFAELYSSLGVGIKDLKPRLLRLIKILSFNSKNKRRIWNLYECINDFDDLLIDHNFNIIQKIESLLLK